MAGTSAQASQIFLSYFFLFSILSKTIAYGEPVPNVPWSTFAEFELDSSLSDEFNDPGLDESKWDTHGLRNPETNCPSWNGPISEDPYSIYSTFYPTSTDPANPGGPRLQQYKIENGRLHVNIDVKDESFFAAREYYCDPSTFHCNHDQTIPCYFTNLHGDAIMKNGSYLGMTHDKCKKEPFCLPHYKYVLNKAERPYRKYVSTHLYGKPMFRYGYVETKVKMARSMALFAVWMHGRDSTGPGWCRFKETDDGGIQRECPSRIKSDRWQEIDFVEAMHSQNHSHKYIPNIHVFQCSKGEFSSAEAVDNGSGEMGGGPIIVNNANFKSPKLFAHVPLEQRSPNTFHMGSGSVYDLDVGWGDKERVVGVYWSASEIRFYVDGLEVHSVQNMLVHQPMSLDISSAINIKWAGHLPGSDEELMQFGEIDYLRVWKVFTPGGVDPPRRNELSDVMVRNFRNRYGYSLRDVHDVFPDNDDRTVYLAENNEKIGRKYTASLSGELTGMAEFVSEKGLKLNTNILNISSRQQKADLYGIDLEGFEIYSTMRERGYKRHKISKSKITKKSKKHNTKRKSKKISKRKEKKKMSVAGGKYGIRGKRKLRRMRKKQRLGELSRPDRAIIVKKEGQDIVTSYLDSAAQTLFDWVDPMAPGAGHAGAHPNEEPL